MIRRARQLTAGLAALTVAAGIVGGVPAALTRFVGWPGPTAWPTAEQLRQFTQTGVDDTTIVKILAVIVWVAWLQLTVAIAAETVAYTQRRAARSLPLLPGFQDFAVKLVAAIALVAATSTLPRTAAATPLATIVTPTAAAALADPAPSPTSPEPPSEVAARTRTIDTTARDSWWRLAEQHLGDGLRWREIRDLNVGRTVADGTVLRADTERVEPGWRLLVPATEPAVTDDADDETAAEESEWRVEPGHHFWGIAEQTLTDAWRRSPTDEEVVPYWQQLIEVNRDRLLPPGDPDLIYPDQLLLAPPAPSDPVSGALEARPAEPPASSTRPDTDAAARPDGPQPQGQAADAGEPTQAPSSRDSWRNAIASHQANAGATSDQPAASPDDEQVTALGVPVGLAAGVAASGLLAAGVVATLRWRRRAALRHRTPGLRLPTPLPEADGEVTRLEAAAVAEQTLDDLAALLASIPPGTHPALATTTDEGDVTLLFDDTQELPDPTAPWELVDDGSDGPVGWRARLGGRGPERSIGLPLLVTLGRTTSTTVLANVAAMRALTVEGPREEVRRRLRAMGLEAATSRLAVPLEVAISGDRALSTLDRVRHVDSLAAEIDAAIAELQHDVVADDRTPRLLICHDHALAPELPETLTGTVGLIAAGHLPTVSWRLDVDDEHTGQLRLPDGGTVQLALPEIDPQLIDDELTRLQATPPAAPDPDGPHTVRSEPTGNGHVTSGREATRPAWCEVRLLGPAEVIRGGARIEDLTPRTLEVLAYLVTHRDGVSKERLDDVVWAGHAPRPGSQRVTAALTKLRNALGDGPDGEPLVPRRTGAERIRLSEHVGSDLDRAFAHLAIARDLPGEMRTRELAAALDLVRGEPFEDLPVSWAADITQRAIAQLQDAALELTRNHREAGDFDAADRAIHKGLLLLDPADALYLERAELEKARGRPERVAQIWRELRRRHAQDADEIAGYVSSPPPEIELAFQELMGV